MIGKLIGSLFDKHEAWSLKRASDKKLKYWYEGAGELFAQVLSESSYGQPVGFDGAFKLWQGRELEYSKRGFKTVSLDDFIFSNRDNTSIDDLFQIKREENEEPILYAEVYLVNRESDRKSLEEYSKRKLT